MDLSTINFSVNTKPLEAAAAVIGELVTNVGKLDKAARDAAQTEATLARAAKLNADANLQNAKAQDTRLKSTITADKADQQAADAIERKTKATERASTAIKKNADMLQLQNDTYDFILEGFSKGDAKVLAMAKATGQLSDQLKQVLTDIRQFSKNTFDQTETGLDRMVKSAKEASSAQGFLNNGLNLTSKQAKELSNDLDRLNIRLQHQGKSYQEITKEQAIYKQRFVEEANAVNRATSALDVVDKQRKDVASATNYLTQADAKMAAALNTSNAALDKAGTDSLVKYETALRKSGISQDVATAKLAKYKAQLEQVQTQEQKRREEHLTRALAPQATDVVVSLWSGQNPLTVLLQQGGQVTDLFMRSGVAAEKFGEVVKSSMKSMLPSILTVAKGIGGLLVDGFMAAGEAVSSFLANAVRMTGALDKMYMKMSENGPSKWGGVIRKLGSLMTGAFAVGVAAVVTGLTLLGVALAQVTKEQNELAKSLNLTGAALGLSADGVIKFAQSIEGVRTTEAISFIQELSKTGAKASADLTGLTKVAVDLEKYGGVALKDTAKAYNDLQSKPFEGLMKLAEGTGQVSQETVDLAVKLKLAGDEVGLLKLANDQFIAANGKAVDSIKEEINPMSALWITVKDGISFAWDGLKDFARTGVVLDTFIASLRVIATGALAIGAIFRGLGKTIALAFSVYAETAAAMNPLSDTTEEQAVKNIQGVFAAYKDDMSDWKNQTDSAFNDIWDKTEKTIGLTGAARAANSNYATGLVNGLGDLEKAYNSIEKSELKKLTRQQAINKAIEDYTQKNKQASPYQLDIIRQGAGAAWDKAQEKTKKDPSENYYATLMREATNNTIAANTAAQELTKSEQKLLEVRADPRFEKLNAIQKQDVVAKYESAIAAEKQTALTEKLAEAEEHRLKLLGKSEGIGKQYYSDMQKLEEFAKVAGWSREEIEELTRAVFMATPAWQKYQKALEEVNSAARKFKEDSLASQAATLKENESLDYRLSLLGKTAEEQRALSIEYNRANKISEVRIKLAKQLRDIEADIEKAKKAGLPEEDYKNLIDAQVQARKDAAEQEKAINREVAVQSAEDLQKEFDVIKNGISDSIVTALFEGGKAGSKKLRNLVVAELRKPVTMVVNAVVNTVLGSIVGSLSGSGGGAGTGSGNLIGTASNIGSAYRVASGFNTGWLTDFGATMPGSIASTGANLYSQGFETIGSSMMDFGNSIAGYADTINVAGDVLGYGTAIFAAADGKWGQAIGSAVGTYFGGPIGSFIGSTIGGFVDDIFSGDAGTYHTGGAASYSVATGQRNSLGFRDNEEGLPSYNPNDNIDNQFGLGFGYVERGDQTISAMEQLSKSLVEIFDGIAKTFGKTAGYEVATAFADDTSEDGAWGAFAVRLQGVEILNWEDFRQSKWAPKEFGDGEEGYKQYLAAIAKDTRQVILDMDLPSWADQILTDLGESASIESLSTAIQQIGVIKGVFDTLTNTLVELSGASDETLAALTTLSGGIEALRANATAYYQNFYSAEEQRANVQKQLAKSFKELGLSMIDIDATDARQQFRDLVEAQDLTTESGRKAYAALLAMAGTFASVTITVEEASAAAEEASAALQQIWKDGVQSAYDILEAAINAQIKILNEQAGASEATISKLKGIFDLLKSAISDLYGEVASTAAMQAAQGYQVIRDAISTGNLPEQSTLSSAISAVRSGISGTDFVSQFEADKARLQFAADLNTLLGQTEEQLSTEELTLKAIKDQIAMLELTLANAKAQLDAINGVNSSVLSVADAIREFQKALIPPTTTNLKEPPRVPSGSTGGGFSSGPGGVSTPVVSNTDQIKDYLNHISLEPVDIRTQMLTRGWTVEEIAAAAGVDVDFARGHIYKDVPKFADGGSYKGGMALVGEEGPELINFSQGGQVYTAGQTASMLSGGDVVGAIESLENRVTDLGYALQAIAINTGKSSRVLERVTPDGDSILISGSVTVA